MLTFVGDGHGVSQSDSSLLCRSEFVHGWRICLLVVGALFVGINWFSLEGHAFHGVDSLVCFVVFFALFQVFVTASRGW